MTDKTVLEVTQRAREYAADAVKAYRDNKNNDWQGRIRRGGCDDGEMVQAFARFERDILATRAPDPTPVVPADGLERLLTALAKVMPIRVQDGPDYAEVYFSDGTNHSTQAMTMNPQDWLDIAQALAAHRGEA